MNFIVSFNIPTMSLRVTIGHCHCLVLLVIGHLSNVTGSVKTLNVRVFYTTLQKQL